MDANERAIVQYLVGVLESARVLAIHGGYSSSEAAFKEAVAQGRALLDAQEREEPRPPKLCACGHPTKRHLRYEDRDECMDCTGDKPCSEIRRPGPATKGGADGA